MQARCAPDAANLSVAQESGRGHRRRRHGLGVVGGRAAGTRPRFSGAALSCAQTNNTPSLPPTTSCQDNGVPASVWGFVAWSCSHLERCLPVAGRHGGVCVCVFKVHKSPQRAQRTPTPTGWANQKSAPKPSGTPLPLAREPEGPWTYQRRGPWGHQRPVVVLRQTLTDVLVPVLAGCEAVNLQHAGRRLPCSGSL